MTAPAGDLPSAVALLSIRPASASACVTVYVPVQVTVAPGAREAAPAGHVTTGAGPVPENAPSAMPIPLTVASPVFLTANE